MEEQLQDRGSNGLKPYLSPVSVWALSFGSAVGWGAFVMPGTTFLPAAGPLGTALGIGIGAVVMLIIGMNYSYLMKRYPEAGGTMAFAIRTFGYDHGFLSAWFLMLVYVAIIWANATALTLIARNLLGSVFQFGFHYQVLKYDVWFGEALLTIGAILLFGFICARGKLVAAGIQTVLALLLFGGVLAASFAVLGRHTGGIEACAPFFSPIDKPPTAQVLHIIALAPWAFAGFESVAHCSEEIRFPVGKTLRLMIGALITGTVSYIALAQLSVTLLPEGYANWVEYVEDLPDLEGLQALPVFYATHEALANGGMILLGVTILAAIITGLIGNYVAASRLLYAMSREKMLPSWFGCLNEAGSPVHAFLFLMGISLFIPFLGRTAISWIVDVNTIGATIAYAYTSAAAFVEGRKEGNRGAMTMGLLGFLLSLLFFSYFMVLSRGAMATESYLILAGWSIFGFVYFRHVFRHDKNRQFGRSVVAWIGLLFLILFTSLMWVRQSTDDMTRSVVENISEYYEERNPNNDAAVITETESYLAQQMRIAGNLQTRNNFIQMGLILASLGIMFSIYTTMSRREREMEMEKTVAEESSKAKTAFLSNMSHDIRTPLNAIIGYTHLAKQEETGPEKVREYLDKIDGSGQHLLALINDVLEMSRIESGKMDLEPIAVDLKKILLEARDMFVPQMEEKGISFTLDMSEVKDSLVMCDKNRLQRVLLNLLSNAYKFTPEGGKVALILTQEESTDPQRGQYVLRVRDSGIGMTKEFAERVFDAFERERTSTVSGIEGTGLGMAITKSIIDLMGGSIQVQAAPGQGTEFVIRVALDLQSGAHPFPEEGALTGRERERAVDFSSMRLLLVEDIAINREIALRLLKNLGFTIETAENGKEAVGRVACSVPGYYDGVLMDIQMPVMDGYEATRAIRGLEDPVLSRIPIIAMTANAFSEDVRKSQEAGMNAHIAKPIDVNTMVSTLKEVLVHS